MIIISTFISFPIQRVLVYYRRRWTIEHESNNSIAFMDALLRRDNHGQLSSIVYPKPTHIHRYLPYDSHHPPPHKRAVVKSLMDRALWHVDFQPPRKIERKKHSAMSYVLYKITATLRASSLKHHNREYIQKLHTENTEVSAPCPTLKGPPNQSKDYWNNTEWRLLWNLLKQSAVCSQNQKIHRHKKKLEMQSTGSLKKIAKNPTQVKLSGNLKQQRKNIRRP